MSVHNVHVSVVESRVSILSCKYVVDTQSLRVLTIVAVAQGAVGLMHSQ